LSKIQGKKKGLHPLLVKAQDERINRAVLPLIDRSSKSGDAMVDDGNSGL